MSHTVENSVGEHHSSGSSRGVDLQSDVSWNPTPSIDHSEEGFTELLAVAKADMAWDTLDRSKVSNVEVPLGPDTSLNPCLRPLERGPPDRGAEEEGAAARFVPLQAWKGARVAMREDPGEKSRTSGRQGREAGQGKLID
ncbi:hypothetical protein GWK47_036804 [Chionoecetes opilio]|uniref:Uncharacterized protein n=1 Tax=Chionoecetes opilio TaxID=41210 RepID=A0A8J5CMX0_CHIOP|nr:hypothetical protein GWK47_036804 [Chionoecetes opilio]